MSWMTEYPRPQLKRDSFFCLNGVWQLDGKDINVPFPPQSRLSGYEGQVGDELHYVKKFALPAGFADNKRVRLHFGAVDQVCKVFVNGKPVAEHEGGYLPFFADVTDVLAEGENELVVDAVDTLSHDYPYGKQRKDRGGMWYTPVSGIWQTVWMEAVPEKAIENVKITPNLKGITVVVEGGDGRCWIEIPGEGKWEAECGKAVRIEIEKPRLWTVDDPYLYDMTVVSGGDRVESYFALRTMEVSGKKILFNGKPLFLNGVLDQGYFEDGIFLPGEPEEYERDVLRMKEMGMNLLRKHIKVEPQAFYYACDRLGMLVMQDMVNTGGYNYLLDTVLPNMGFLKRNDRCRNPEKDLSKVNFTKHSLDILEHLHSHPCVVSYTIFNEGWGQFNADYHYDLLKNADSTRVYDATSGWFWQKKSDVDSWHIYFRNKKVKGGTRPGLLSECGGYARPIDGHMFNPKNEYGYGTAATEEALTAKIELMWEEMVYPSIEGGLCGVIFTQISDVEDEINGLYTYDRQVCKATPARLSALVKKAQEMLEKTE